MGHIIAVANQKGGVGKTTTAINLAASLAHSSCHTLLIDMDPQGSASSGIGIDKNGQNHIYKVFTKENTINEVVQRTPFEWLDIVPSTFDLIGAEIELINQPGREYVLRDSLTQLQTPYPFIIIDCPPSLGLLTLNALAAATSVLIPLQCEYYALEGLSQLLHTVERIKVNINTALEIAGVVLTMYDSRTNLGTQVTEEVKKFFGDKVYSTIIPRNVRLAEAPSHGLPALIYDLNSAGAQAYLKLAQELIAKMTTVPLTNTKDESASHPVIHPSHIIPLNPPLEKGEGKDSSLEKEGIEEAKRSRPLGASKSLVEGEREGLENITGETIAVTGSEGGNYA